MMSELHPETSPDPVESDFQSEYQQENIEILVNKLEIGNLTQDEQRRLFEFLKQSPPSVVLTATRHQTFIGPIPPPDHLKQYDSKTRDIIVGMARDEQRHVHELRVRGLNGAIEKDKRGQRIGGAIAITGLLVAALIAPHSAIAAAIIGSLDLFGMVALFVAPRVIEGRKSPGTERTKKIK
jgi:uncharacterized membrane protein